MILGGAKTQDLPNTQQDPKMPSEYSIGFKLQALSVM